MKPKRIILVIVVIFSLFLFFRTIYFLYLKNEKKPVVYKSEKLFKTTILKKAVATGTIIPRKEVLIKSNVSGIVEKVFIQPGKSIKVGEPICKIKIIPDMLSVNDAQNRLDRAIINLNQAETEWKRIEGLAVKDVVSKQELLSAEVNYKNAKQEKEASEKNLQLIKEGSTKDMGMASNTIIKSTINGMVLDIPIKEGNNIIQSNNFNEGTTIASVADMNEMVFEGKVDESEVGKLKVGMPLIVTVGAINDQQFNASLEYLSPKGIVENGTVQFTIKAKIDLKLNYFLRANYSATADIVIEKKENINALNESVLIFENNETFVEVKNKDGSFTKQKIKTGLSDGINIEILDGVSEKDEIKGKEIIE